MVPRDRRKDWIMFLLRDNVPEEQGLHDKYLACIVSVFVTSSRSPRCRSISKILSTKSKPASSSWCPAPFGASDQMLHLFE
jgi:hypothetical protein